MQKIIFCFIFWSNIAVSDKNAFIAIENNVILCQEGDCDKRYAPMSTFKIFLSLIGFDSGILIDEINPVWSVQEDYIDWRDVWKQNQTPKSWIQHSCVWYSQVLTKRLGMKKFSDYVRKCKYGNQDISGDKDADNGLTNAWLSSSLQISCSEQIEFLAKMLTGKLHISKNALRMTCNILFVEELKNGWKLYGKTGMGTKKIYHGWFIGWIEKGNRRIIFANHMIDDAKKDTIIALQAKENTKEKLIKIIKIADSDHNA